MILGFIKTGEETCITTTETTGEDVPQLYPSLSSEAYTHEYMHQESDSAERSFRSRASLTKIVMQEKFVSSYSVYNICIGGGSREVRGP